MQVHNSLNAGRASGLQTMSCHKGQRKSQLGVRTMLQAAQHMIKPLPKNGFDGLPISALHLFKGAKGSCRKPKKWRFADEYPDGPPFALDGNLRIGLCSGHGPAIARSFSQAIL